MKKSLLLLLNLTIPLHLLAEISTSIYSTKEFGIVPSDGVTAPFVFSYANTYWPAADPCLFMGYNARPNQPNVDPRFHAWAQGLEGSWDDGSGEPKCEYFLQYQPPDASYFVRPFFIQARASDGKPVVGFFNLETLEFRVPDGSPAGECIGQISATDGVSLFSLFAPPKKGAIIAMGWNGHQNVLQIIPASPTSVCLSIDQRPSVYLFARAGGGRADSVSIGTEENSAVLGLQVNQPTQKGLWVRATADQSEPMFEVQAADSNPLVRTDARGNTGFGVARPNSSIHTKSFASAIRVVSSNDLATDADDVIVLKGNAVTVTLPVAATCGGRHYTIKAGTGSDGQVKTSNSELIDESEGYYLSSLAYVTVVSDGQQWWVIGGG